MLRGARDFLNSAWGGVQSFLRDRPDSYTREFAHHNKATWRGYRKNTSDGEILIEANNIPSCNIAMSYIGSYLSRTTESEMIVYAKGMSRANKTVYESFADSFLCYSPELYCSQIDHLFSEAYSRVSTKRELEGLIVEGLPIGDLIYDSYIRKYDKTTVDISSPELAEEIKAAIGYLLFWRAYFDSHSVKAIVLSHTVFTWAGVILRLAVERFIPVYFASPIRLYYITNSHNSRSYNEYIDYPRHFAALSAEKKAVARQAAKEKLDLRFRGIRDVGLHHSLGQTFTSKTGERAIEESPRLKVMVATHCFSDDNHVYGDNLFPDFYEWLSFLGDVSERTDYDWYIKLHPDRFDWETQHIEELVRRYPRFRILQAEVSHNQIIADGIDCVLTVYGTIGFEYAAHGVPVVTASPWNPTMAYNFNLHAKTVEDYEKILTNLKEAKIDIDQDEIREYYYCHFIDVADDWLYDDYSNVSVALSEYGGAASTFAYRIFLEQYSEQKHARILDTVDKFVRSKDYCLRPKHFSSEFEE